MRSGLSRLRSGEVIAGAGALALLISMLVLPWYAVKFTPTTIDGYNEYIHLRWLLLLTIAVVFALVLLQATRPAPALPASFSVIALVLCVLTSLWLIYRVLINVPDGGGVVEQRYGAYVGLVCALVMTYGAYRSLREETKPDPERNARIPVVELESNPAASADLTRDA